MTHLVSHNPIPSFSNFLAYFTKIIYSLPSKQIHLKWFPDPNILFIFNIFFNNLVKLSTFFKGTGYVFSS